MAEYLQEHRGKESMPQDGIRNEILVGNVDGTISLLVSITFKCTTGSSSIRTQPQIVHKR